MSRAPILHPVMRSAQVRKKLIRSPKNTKIQKTTMKASLWNSMINLMHSITIPAMAIIAAIIAAIVISSKRNKKKSKHSKH